MIVFTEWLKEQGAYDEYMKFFDESWASFDYTYTQNYISAAFLWESSDSDFNFWKGINLRWQGFIESSHRELIYFSEAHIPKEASLSEPKRAKKNMK